MNSLAWWLVAITYVGILIVIVRVLKPKRKWGENYKKGRR